MTKPTTDPIKLLEDNILELETSLEYHEGLQASARREMERAKDSLDLATSRHQRRYEEVEAVKKSMITHREAIAQLSSLQSGGTVVVNLSPISIDKDVPGRDIEDEEDEFERMPVRDDR